MISNTIYWTAVTSAVVLAAILTVTWRLMRQRNNNGETIASPAWYWWDAGRNLWQNSIRNNDSHMMQVVVAVACAGVSISMGYAYATLSWVDGWQLWTWMLTIVVLVATLIPNSVRFDWSLHTWRWPLLFLLGAFVLRLTLLNTIPGGLHVDEKGVAGYAVLHVFPPEAQTINPFHTGAASQPALYHYLIRLSLAVFGYSIHGLRISSAVVGGFAVMATYFMVKQFANTRTALLTAAIMMTYHYHIHWSRLALNNIWDTLWVPLIIWPLAWGYRKNWSGGAVISGLALGLSQYFYAGSKIAVFMVPLLLWMLYREKKDRGQLLRFGVKLTVTAVTVAAPIAFFALMVPDTYFDRSRTVYAWQTDAIMHAVGKVDYGAYLWHQIWRNVGAFTTVPEITGFYGPGVPFLIGVAAPLFVIGLFWVIWKRQWVPIMWLLFTLFFGGIMLTGAPSSSHLAVSIPVICWLTAVPLNWLWQRGHWKLAAFLLAAIMLTDLIFYFGVYVPGEPRDLFHVMPEWPFSS
ncbi:MAG: glycosyltransferase family 39 protein [Chloroflexi bacterium]|nr:glycosyltransferase family 39 protein [Chloroflexota bacterium]